MSTGLQFDPAMSKGIEAQYRRPQMVQRRARALALADPRVGQHVLDVGCGPGYLTADLAAGVTESGSVVGIDQSDSMLGLAGARCEGLTQVRLEKADATKLPLADASMDLALSTQVLEYVADVDAALVEMARVLRPGGRAVLLATDWRSVAWYSSDEERMTRMLSAWEEHLAHPTLPRTLATRLGGAGLRVDAVERYSVLERSGDVADYASMMIMAIASFAPGRRGVTKDEAVAWADEQGRLRAEGGFHFSVGQYFFTASRSEG